MATFDAERWQALVDGSACPMCAENAQPDSTRRGLVARLPSGNLLLQNDADFPGYCVLVHQRHVTELHDLDAVERAQLIEDIAAASRAISAVCRPDKVNYAILGNEVPHLHCHVIPRYPYDGYWGAPIWNRPAALRAELPSSKLAELLATLQHAIGEGAK